MGPSPLPVLPISPATALPTLVLCPMPTVLLSPLTSLLSLLPRLTTLPPMDTLLVCMLVSPTWLTLVWSDTLTALWCLLSLLMFWPPVPTTWLLTPLPKQVLDRRRKSVEMEKYYLFFQLL